MAKRLRYFLESQLVNALILSTLYQLFVYLANRRFWRQQPPLPPESDPSLSVIVPLRGKSRDTLALLHLMVITGPTPHYEVILVLEDDRDPAYPLAQEVAGSYPGQVQVILSGPAANSIGKTHNLNAGLPAAHGDLIAFVDADVQLNAELWNTALSIMADPTVGAAFAPPLLAEPEQRGMGALPTGGEMLTALHINHARTAGIPFAAMRHHLPDLAGGFIITRRRVLDEAGGLLHLREQAADDVRLGRAIRETGYRLAVIPIPATIIPAPETFNEATADLLRRLILARIYHPRDYFAWPFTNPLTVGFALGWITEREGRWWGRRTWWGFAWLRLMIAYQLDRIRFGRGFTWIAYAQLLMLDTFISPVLWLRALFQNTITWGGRTYRVQRGGKITRLD